MTRLPLKMTASFTVDDNTLQSTLSKDILTGACNLNKMDIAINVRSNNYYRITPFLATLRCLICLYHKQRLLSMIFLLRLLYYYSPAKIEYSIICG